MARAERPKIHERAATPEGMQESREEAQAEAKVDGAADEDRQNDDGERKRDLFESEDSRGRGGAAAQRPLERAAEKDREGQFAFLRRTRSGASTAKGRLRASRSTHSSPAPSRSRRRRVDIMRTSNIAMSCIGSVLVGAHVRLRRDREGAGEECVLRDARRPSPWRCSCSRILSEGELPFAVLLGGALERALGRGAAAAPAALRRIYSPSSF